MSDQVSINEMPKRLAALAATFPVIRQFGAPLDTLDGFVEWGLNQSRGTLHVVRFVLSVYNTRAPERFGLEPFDMHAAMGRWDGGQRAAFAAWAQEPFWL